ncbi:TIGR02530 family flagellar biosynthesis protein [Clostridium arbusti]|uniref:TIGR02530 family flagellar biosynthesis protein n=1 Tax=Clostridium arbusti TaxID=1137848 RepID=UPI000287EB4E|nr:TIGR02530 family flagellar biosynthesis protein [Clostridium arbusti]
MSYRVINGQIHPIEPIGGFSQQKSTEKSKNNVDFKDILKKEINEKEGFNISAHAAERLRSRSISLNEQDMKTINEGINKAEQKGCKNSVILYKDLALVTSIKNRTVITAVDKNSAKNNVFTNVDSVVLL